MKFEIMEGKRAAGESGYGAGGRAPARMRAENSGIQTDGCDFRRSDAEILSDFEAEFSKT